MRLTIEYDECVESPADDSQWEIYSFSSRHRNFKHPENFFPLNIGLRRKLEVGTAFLLSYYEHGLCLWSLSGEGPNCRWDSVGTAGILIYRDPIKYLPKEYSERAEYARSFLKEYTEWCNGEVFCYCIESESECDKCEQVEREIIDSCGGFIGSESILDSLKDEHPELFEKEAKVEVVGNASYIF